MKQVYIVRSQNQLTLIPRVKHFQTIPYIPKTDYIFLNLTQATTIPLQYSIQVTKV